VNAINKYILAHEEDGDDVRNVTSETFTRWAAQRYQKEAGDDNHHVGTRRRNRRRLSALPSRNGIVVFSYETMVKLGGTYVKMLYDALGIESNYIPDDIRNSNKKYLNTTMT